MEIIGIILLIWIVFCAFWAVFTEIVKIIKQGIRDKAAHKALDDSFDYEQEKADILAINKKFSLKNEVKKTVLERVNESQWKKNDWHDFIHSLK
jgi:hypothetical protein